MTEEKFNIALGAGVDHAEVIIRDVKEVNELKIKAPVKIDITGTIGCVSEFLRQRHDQPDQINQKRCHVLVDRENISLSLIYNENDEYIRGTVKGKLEVHPKFEEFGINTGKLWAPIELGMFFKMNRAFFTEISANRELVTTLMNFTATVNSNIERSAKENGDRSDKFAQTVDSNLPAAFTLKIPIFKGKPAEVLEIETFAKINGREVSFLLISPAANQLTEDIRDKEIDSQIEDIRNICPEIAIIEI